MGWGDVSRQLCRQVRRKISVHVDGELSGGSHMRRPESEASHLREHKFKIIFAMSGNSKQFEGLKKIDHLAGIYCCSAWSKSKSKEKT